MRVSTTKNITYTSNRTHAIIHVHQFDAAMQKINKIDLHNSYSGRMGDRGVVAQLDAAIDALNELKAALIKQGKNDK